jgi:hypothetical protein
MVEMSMRMRMSMILVGDWGERGLLVPCVGWM